MKIIKWCKNFILSEDNKTGKLHPAIIYEEIDKRKAKVKMITKSNDFKTKRELNKDEVEFTDKNLDFKEQSFITKDVIEADMVILDGKHIEIGKTTLFYKD